MRVLRNVLLLVSTALLAIAFLWRREWLILLVLPAAPAFWIAFRSQSVLWRSSCLLVAYVATSAVGSLDGSANGWVLVGTVAALATWDLTNFLQELEISADPNDAAALRRSHLLSLAWALGAGMMLSLLTLAANLNLPFAVVGLLGLIVVASLTAAASYLGGMHR